MPARLRDGLVAALPLAPAPLLFGASFGLLAGEAGMSAAAAIVMSATTFAGSAQFAAGSILETGGGALAATVAALLLNARYAPMSVAVAGIFPGSRGRRFLESQLIVDESWALSGKTGRFEYPVLAGSARFSICSGSAGPRSGSSSGTRSATRTRSGSTPPSPRSSSRCWFRTCGCRARSPRPSSPPRSRSSSRRSRPPVSRSWPRASPVCWG